MMGKTIADILIVFFFVFVNAFFSGTEMAVITLNDAKMRKMSEEGDRKARRIVRFLDNPGNFLATIQVGVTLAGFLSSAFAASNFAEKLAVLCDPDGKYPWMVTLWTVIITIVLSYFSLVLGELVPKRIAQTYPEKWSFGVTGIVNFFSVILKPFVILLTASTNAVLRLFRIDPDDNDKAVTEEEIRMMVDVGSESGNIEDTEKKMIENVFEFNDKEVSEIMTHRKRIVSLPIDSEYEEVMKVAMDEKFTRIPVYRDTIDDIVGILNIKDLLGIEAPDTERPFILANIIRDPLVVHETRKISSLFGEMKTSGMQMAVIVDEYGGTMGICTIEDMLEELVGNITDEYDDEEQELVKLSNGDYIVDGDMTLSDLEDVIGIELTDDEYDTIAGLVISLLDRVPEEREKPVVHYKNIDIKVLKVAENAIAKVMIHKNPVITSEDGDNGEEASRE
ncbi:MAG: hemolysin family protein [Saccharofermentans sp.]|jgi:putative hemolysin|nr:hemolysin family protein [Mageeibacillus sp.]MCI1264144.1 hemolysin family protein [Saccharofermentans sp.]MCI1275385.1 hemolysin family protein [Saccharofermentans sp.]MCI1768742.1 hemolysin family protein [Mageeibacillus sp.]